MNYVTGKVSEGYAREVQPAAPQHPLPSAIDSLGYTINDLAATAEMVNTRLESVLMPHPPTDAAGLARPALGSVAPVTSPMVGEVEAQRQRIQNITAGLQDVLNRLEV